MAGLTFRAASRSGAAPAVQVGATATVAAFSPGASINVTAQVHPLSPSTPFGVAVWVGVGAIVLLALIRHSLPK